MKGKCMERGKPSAVVIKIVYNISLVSLNIDSCVSLHFRCKISGHCIANIKMKSEKTVSAFW